MDKTEFEQELALERRGRLAAERLLEHKQAELREANRQLSDHALSLSGQIVDQRKVVSNLQGENCKVSEDLQRANTRVVAVEKLLWESLENIPDGFALFSPDFRLIAANGPYLSAFKETSGVSPGDSYQAILDICLDDGLVDLQGEDEDAWYDWMLDRWDSATIKPATLRFWNGMHVKMVDRRTADGGIVSLALNITDTIRREEELRDARDKAQAADRAKSAFLAKMSHELRTPMNGVVGMADLLLERELDEEANLYVDTIRDSGQALLEIINDILDFSRIEADRLELKAQELDLSKLAQDVLTLFQPTLRDQPIQLQLDYDPSLGTLFLGDSGRLRQIFVNLVGNAIKFTEAGHVVLRISGPPHSSKSKGTIHISVEDTGYGVPEGMREHIFGEFNQVEDEASRQCEGTGLGLAITRRLIEAMKGTLWLESVEGRGSCFGFELDLPRNGGDDPPQTALTADMSRALLWIEDELDRAIIERLLISFGLEVWSTSSASEFDLALERRAPHLVLCGVSRRDATEAILAECPGSIALVSVADATEQTSDLERPYTRAALISQLKSSSDAAPTPIDRQLRVLAAEDNKTNQLVLTKMLSGLDIELNLVDDGLQALEHYKLQTPDLIFLDISMPKMDGMEVARSIRTLEDGKAHVPIVAMTAHALSGDEDRIRASGIDHYLTKPLSKAALRQHIEAVAGRDVKLAEIAG